MSAGSTYAARISDTQSSNIRSSLMPCCRASADEPSSPPPAAKMTRGVDTRKIVRRREDMYLILDEGRGAGEGRIQRAEVRTKKEEVRNELTRANGLVF